MKKFKNREKESDYSIIIGCGRLGASIADNLSEKGRSVMVVDKNSEAFKRLSFGYGGLTFNGDASEIYVLNEINVEKAKSVVVATNNDNTNILIAQLIKERYNVPRVIARLYEPEKACVYEDADIMTLCPAVLSANEIKKLLNIDTVEP
ncbi:MAG: TrkA family potassium uptake protein [Clostridiales bacterium]|jgi:trk system potassium uptake protein TrkA|nr:TrkA family potassium uptake protein [Clostridiales bacterium]